MPSTNMASSQRTVKWLHKNMSYIIGVYLATTNYMIDGYKMIRSWQSLTYEKQNGRENQLSMVTPFLCPYLLHFLTFGFQNALDGGVPVTKKEFHGDSKSVKFH